MGYGQLLGVTGALSYIFINAQAKTYWNALTAANGSEVQGSVYGTTTNLLKKAIDDFFITGNTDGWLVKLLMMYPEIGATANTHAINAINPGTFNGTFVGSPTHNATGFLVNGTTQYMECNNMPSTDGYSNTDFAAGGLVTGVTVGASDLQLAGSAGSATSRDQISRILTTGYWRTDLFNNTTARISTLDATNDKVMIATKPASGSAILYLDGSSIGSHAINSGTLPSFETYLGAANSIGTAVQHINGTIKFYFRGYGLTAVRVTSLTNAIKNLQIALGR